MATEFGKGTFEQVTVTTSASLLTALSARPTNARHCIIRSEDYDIRYRCDGTDPTSSVGLIMEVNKDYIFENQATILDAMKVIAATDSTVNVHWFE